MLRKLRDYIAEKSMTTFKGNLTYGSVVAILLPVVSALLGVEIVPADVEPFYRPRCRRPVRSLARVPFIAD
jgi:hypothetical protein